MTEAEDRYKAVRDRLIEVARSRGLTTYGELAKISGLAARSVGRLVLDAISRDEASEGRPMLSAVVVDAKGRTGDGFFKMAAAVGRARSPDRSEAFLTAEREAVYAEWSRPTDRYEAVRDKLIEVARNRERTTYGELARITGLPARSVGPLVLDAISRDEANANRPMLSAVVVDAEGRTGSGFFRLAADLGRTASPDRDEAFLTAEREAAYRYWGRPAS